MSDQLTLFAEDFPARTSPTQASRQGWRENAAASGRKSPVWLANYDRASSSWRTSQLSLLEDSGEFSGTWPRSGTMRNGTAYQLPPLVPLTYGTGFGSSPTHSIPTAQDHIERESTSAETLNPLTNKSVSLDRWVRFWPTPNVAGGGNPPHLLTPKGNHFVRRSGQKAHLSLDQAVKMWPTPGAADNRDRGNLSMPSIQRRQKLGKQLNLSMVVHPTSGSLNPTWVEWLMGFPLGWTDCGDSATRSSRKSRK